MHIEEIPSDELARYAFLEGKGAKTKEQ